MKPYWLTINTHKDHRGSLSFLEKSNGLPFDVKRIYYLYDVPITHTRGHHSHHELEQVFICLNGSFEISLHDGVVNRTFYLNDPARALFVPKRTWRVLENFAHNTVCLVLASHEYSEEDYIRDFTLFLENKKNDK